MRFSQLVPTMKIAVVLYIVVHRIERMLIRNGLSTDERCEQNENDSGLRMRDMHVEWGGEGRGKRYIIQASRSSTTSSRLIIHHSRSHLVIFFPLVCKYVRTYDVRQAMVVSPRLFRFRRQLRVSVDHCSLTSRLRIDGILLFLANVSGIIATYQSNDARSRKR